MNRKGKSFLLISLSGLMVFTFAIFGKNFSESISAKAAGNNSHVEDVIEFDGSKATKIRSESPYLFKSSTKNGEDIYIATKSSVPLESGSISSFRSSMEGDFDSVICFYGLNSESYTEYVFQNVNAIKVESKNAISQIGVFVKEDGGEYVKVGTMAVNESSSGPYAYEGSFALTDFEDSSIKLVQESMTGFKAQIKRISLAYTCDTGYVPPVKHEVRKNPTTNGSIDVDTSRKHKAGDLVNFTVTPAQGYVVQSVSTVPVVDLSISGSSYTFEMPESDISINATFEPAPVVTYNVSAQTLSFGSVSFERTQYYENESVAFTVSANNGYEIDQVSTNPSLSVSGSDGSYSFTMPASDVEVIPTFKQITSLSFSGDYQTEFNVGDTFNYDNLVVTANYGGGSSKVVSDYAVSTPDMSTAGTKAVTVTYRGVSNTYQINVTAPDVIERIEISGNYKVNYHYNESIDHTGVVVKAVYSSGNKVDVTSQCTFVDPSTSSWTILGKKVTVNYLQFSSYYNIKIFGLDSISLSGQYSSSNTTFTYGDEFSLKGITVEATYKCSYDGGTDYMYEDVTSKVTCSGYNMTSVSNSQTVTVTYNDGHDSKSTTYTIKVNDVLDHISYVAGTGAKTTYKVGETFDKTGFVIYKHMKSGAQSDVTSSATFNAPAFTEEGNYNVVVSYTGAESINIPVTVEKGEDPEPSFSGTFVCSSKSDIKMYFDGNGSGYYDYYNNYARITFTYSISGTAITITKVAETGDGFPNFYYLFSGSSTVNSTSLITSDSTFTIKTYTSTGSASSRTFTKQ